MANLVFCNQSTKIWQFSTGSTLAPLLRHTANSNVHSLASQQQGGLTLAWGPGGREIHRIQGGTDVVIYKHPTTIRTVRVREVGGQERIYFSAGKGGFATDITIYYLQGQSPVPYYSINIQDLTVPNPCVQGETIAYYTGDFAFGSGDTMYLSTGNLGGLAQAGVYQVSGAGPDIVTGGVTRIYLGQGPIEGLCYVAPSTLFFIRSYEVLSLDLTAMTEKLEHDLAGWGVVKIYDLAEAPPGGPSYLLLKVLLALILKVWKAVFVVLQNVAWGRGWKSRRDVAQRLD